MLDTIHDYDGNLGDVLQRAAEILQPIFQQNDWTWWGQGVPNKETILAMLQRGSDHVVQQDDPDQDWWESGRLVICKDPFNEEDGNTYRVFLDLGSVSYD